MGIEVVHEQGYLTRAPIMHVQEFLDLYGPVDFRPSVGHRHMPFATKGLKKHKQIADILAILFIIRACRTPCFCRKRPARSLYQLPTGPVHKNKSPCGIEISLVNTHIFHNTYKSSTRMRWNASLLVQPGLQLGFWEARCTASCEMPSMYPGSTILSASKRITSLDVSKMHEISTKKGGSKK